jgi:hypothetical protein
MAEGATRVSRPHLALAFRRRRTVTDLDLVDAGVAYARARKKGVRDPLTAVAEELHVSRATAGRRVKAARDRRLMPDDLIDELDRERGD